jgi:hypothetical protein
MNRIIVGVLAAATVVIAIVVYDRTHRRAVLPKTESAHRSLSTLVQGA